MHRIEEEIIRVIKNNKCVDLDILEQLCNLDPDQIKRGLEWLKLKDIISIDKYIIIK